MKTLRERFDQKWMPEPNSGCWLWFGAQQEQGYGRFWIDGTDRPSHRISWILTNGPIPGNLCVLHKCDTPACVRPDHLFLGTRTDNAKDRHDKNRSKGGSMKGEKNPSAKLTWVAVHEIRKSIGPLKPLAARYGVSVKTISSVRLKRKWRGGEKKDVQRPVDDFV